MTPTSEPVQWGGRTLTKPEVEVLSHTANNGRYVTDEQSVIEMGKAGLLHDHGPQQLAGGMHYFTMTHLGRMMLRQYNDARPKPKPFTKAQQRYRDFLNLDGSMSFIEYLQWTGARKRAGLD